MCQLELDLYPYRSKTISEGENQIIYWHDNISEDKDKIFMKCNSLYSYF